MHTLEITQSAEHVWPAVTVTLQHRSKRLSPLTRSMYENTALPEVDLLLVFTSFRFGWRGCVLQEGQTDKEGRACSFDGFEPDVPPMLFNEFATEEDSQASTADPVGLTIGRPDKTSKKVGLLFFRDADPLIPNTDECLLPLNVLEQGHLDRPSCWAVFDGVGEQIREHLLDASPIQGRQQGREGCRECQAMVAGALLDLYDHALAQGFQIRR